MIYTKRLAILIAFILTGSISYAQDIPKKVFTDSSNSVSQKNEQVYNLHNEGIYIYRKPRLFGFITRIPADARQIALTACNKKSIKPLLVTVTATVVLLMTDPYIVKDVQQFSRNIHLDPAEKNKTLLSAKFGSKQTTILKLPGNINTAFYQLGQGMPALLIAGGLYVFGKTKHNYRALSTASQLTEAFILMGVGTQILKRVTGRQTPGEATIDRGKWTFLPSFKNFQQHTPQYDAFPSGHLATMMSSITVLAENYPENKWIKPVGYSLTGLLALSMINNGVHWASDYPLAIGLGYLCGRQLAKSSRKLLSAAPKKQQKEISYTLAYTNRVLCPGIVYKF